MDCRTVYFERTNNVLEVRYGKFFVAATVCMIFPFSPNIGMSPKHQLSCAAYDTFLTSIYSISIYWNAFKAY